MVVRALLLVAGVEPNPGPAGFAALLHPPPPLVVALLIGGASPPPGWPACVPPWEEALRAIDGDGRVADLRAQHAACGVSASDVDVALRDDDGVWAPAWLEDLFVPPPPSPCLQPKGADSGGEPGHQAATVTRPLPTTAAAAGAEVVPAGDTTAAATDDAAAPAAAPADSAASAGSGGEPDGPTGGVPTPEREQPPRPRQPLVPHPSAQGPCPKAPRNGPGPDSPEPNRPPDPPGAAPDLGPAVAGGGCPPGAFAAVCSPVPAPSDGPAEPAGAAPPSPAAPARPPAAFPAPDLCTTVQPQAAPASCGAAAPAQAPSRSAVAASEWLVPLLHAVAARTGRQPPPGAGSLVATARADYGGWRAAQPDRQALPTWAALVDAAALVVGDAAIPRARYISAAHQDALLGIRDGVLPEPLLVVHRWVHARAAARAAARGPTRQPTVTTDAAPRDGAAAASAAPTDAAAPPSPSTPPATSPFLSAEQLAAVRSGSLGVSIVDLPKYLCHRMAHLLLRLLRRALACGPGEVPELAFGWYLVTLGPVCPVELRRRLDLAERQEWGQLHARVAAAPPRRTTADHRSRTARLMFGRGSLAKGLDRLNAGPRLEPPSLADVMAVYPPPPAPCSSGPPSPVPPRTDAPDQGDAEPVDSLRAAVDERARHGGGPHAGPWKAKVAAKVKAGAEDSAAGPDGVRPAHLRQLWTLPGVGADLADAVCDLVHKVAEGAAPRALYALAMSPVPKTGGWRPIGVGSVFRRIAAAIAADELTPCLREELESAGQLGLARAGAQRFYLRAQRAASDGLIVARLDVANAFNTLHRSVVTDTAAALAARLVGPARAAAGVLHNLYSDSEDVHVRTSDGPHVVVNGRGVAQGCAGGSLLFALAMAGVLRSTTARLATEGAAFRALPPLASPAAALPGDVAYVALHDDVVFVADDAGRLLAALDAFAHSLAAAGLALGGKSVLVVSPGREVCPALADRFGGRLLGAAKCAGAPLWAPGCEDAARAMAKEIAEARLQPLHALAGAHPQDIVRFLRHAGPWSRLAYLASLIPDFDDVLDAAAEAMHDVTCRLLAAALGHHAMRASRVALLAAFAPAAHGGLGVPSPFIEVALAPLRHASLRLADDPAASLDDLSDQRDAVDKRRAAAYDIIGTLLAITCESSDLSLVRLAHQARAEARAIWSLNACERDRTLMSPPVASKALDAWLFGDLVPTTCDCGEAAAFVRASASFRDAPSVGPSGDEALHVHTCALNKTIRHNHVRDVVADVGNGVAPGHVLVEQGVTQSGSPYAADRRAGEAVPGDVVCRKGRSGAWLFVDVTVVCDANNVAREARLIRAGTHRMLLVEGANRGKCNGRTQGRLVLSSHADYRPAALSPFGAFDVTTRQSIRTLASAIDSHTDVPPPLGGRSTAVRLQAAVSVAVHAADAAFAITYSSTPPPSVPFEASSAFSERLAAAIRAPLERDPSWWGRRERPAILRSLSAHPIDPPPDGSPVAAARPALDEEDDALPPAVLGYLRDALAPLLTHDGDVGTLCAGVAPPPPELDDARVAAASAVRPRAQRAAPTAAPRAPAAPPAPLQPPPPRCPPPPPPPPPPLPDPPSPLPVPPVGREGPPPLPLPPPSPASPAAPDHTPDPLLTPHDIGDALAVGAAALPAASPSSDVSLTNNLRRALPGSASSDSDLPATNATDATRPHRPDSPDSTLPPFNSPHWVEAQRAARVAARLAATADTPPSQRGTPPVSANPRRPVDPRDTAAADRRRLHAASTGRLPGSVRAAQNSRGGRGRGRFACHGRGRHGPLPVRDLIAAHVRAAGNSSGAIGPAEGVVGARGVGSSAPSGLPGSAGPPAEATAT